MEVPVEEVAVEVGADLAAEAVLEVAGEAEVEEAVGSAYLFPRAAQVWWFLRRLR